MAWFRNHYVCGRCHRSWEDEWSCMCEDDCPYCGARHMSPSKGDDLTKVVEREGRTYVAMWSPETAEHDPDYRAVGRFSTRRQAQAFLARYS